MHLKCVGSLVRDLRLCVIRPLIKLCRAPCTKSFPGPRGFLTDVDERLSLVDIVADTLCIAWRYIVYGRETLHAGL